MTIANETDIHDRLKAYRAYLTNADARAALDLLINAAYTDPRYVFDPASHGNIERTVNYVVATRKPYAFIVNKQDLLFYFRKPSGLASAEKLATLLAAGLDATGNNSGEVRVRIRTEDDARKTLEHLSFGSQDGMLHAQLGSARLPAETLRKATPEFVFEAVQRLLAGDVDHPFGPSTDYDLIADDGSRLPPKAVFGIALSQALGGAHVTPKHFTAGDTSTCFRLLRLAGYQVVPKGELAGLPAGDVDADEDAEWSEGKQRLVSHLRRERGPGLAAAKKAQFRKQHGKLVCERCGLDPVAHYGVPEAEACIEVHHAEFQVAEMSEGHKTRLPDLKCLCANCHRLIHRALRSGLQLDA